MLMLSAVLVAGCRQDMHDAPRYEAFEASTTFADNRASRTSPAGTVARGWLREDEALYTGKVAGQNVETFPFAIAHADLQRGQQRFNIYCTPCHGRLGDGNGMVVQRGYRQAASFHQDRLRQDRWLIVAYIRTLQLSQHATVDDVPAGSRAELDASPTGAPASTPSVPASSAGSPPVNRPTEKH
jgi:mono/diheme cytochrome c family protein